MNQEKLIEEIEEAISTAENIKSRLFDDCLEWGGETKKSLNNVINRLNEYENTIIEKQRIYLLEASINNNQAISKNEEKFIVIKI